ncbi:hypothetical protein AB205_0016090, partial [Aquarana catesbeiana]
MSAEGFERTSGQCRAKLKKLKGQYKKFKDNNSRSGNSQSTWRWYDAMDAIYGHRPANQGREGGLDSATAILESMIDPFETSDASNVSDDGPSTSFSSTSTISSSQPQSSQPQSMHPGTLVRHDDNIVKVVIVHFLKINQQWGRCAGGTVVEEKSRGFSSVADVQGVQWWNR